MAVSKTSETRCSTNVRAAPASARRPATQSCGRHRRLRHAPAPIFAALVALAATPALHAQSFTLSGRNVDIPVPPGFCVADESQAERPIVERIRYGIGPNNRMLLVAAPCDQLAQLRALEVLTAEAGFDDYAVFTVLAPDGEIRLLERYDRPGFVRLMREGMGDSGIVDDGLRAAQERLRHLSSTDQRLQSLGVLGSDASGVYFGLVATRATADGRQKDHVVCVGAATLVKDHGRRHRPLKRMSDPSDLAPLLARQKSTSPPSSRPTPEPDEVPSLRHPHRPVLARDEDAGPHPCGVPSAARPWPWASCRCASRWASPP